MPVPPITIEPRPHASRGERVTIEHRGSVFPIECEYCGRPYPPPAGGDSCLGCGAGVRRPFLATDIGRPVTINSEPIKIEINLPEGEDWEARLEEFERQFKEALK